MLKKLNTIFFMLIFLCSGAHASDKLTLTGSSTLAPLMADIAELFEAQNSDCRIDIQTGGSSRGIADAHRGLAHLGMSSRSLYEKENKGVTIYTIAMDGVSFIVNKNNKVRELSSKDAKDILTGKIKNWKELGGDDHEIAFINRAKGRSEYDLVTKFLKVDPKEIKADAVAGENQQCIKIISNNKYAISYISIGTALYESLRGTPIALTTLDKVAPTTQNLKEGKLPIRRPLILISKEQPNEHIKKFLDFALSKEVQHLVTEQSFVSIH